MVPVQIIIVISIVVAQVIVIIIAINSDCYKIVCKTYAYYVICNVWKYYAITYLKGISLRWCTNLWDNLSARDKQPIPKVSSLQRFTVVRQYKPLDSANSISYTLSWSHYHTLLYKHLCPFHFSTSAYISIARIHIIKIYIYIITYILSFAFVDTQQAMKYASFPCVDLFHII